MSEKPKTVDRRTLKTKRAIRNAFAKLLSEREINDITVSDIADLADINRKTFYNYYAGIYEVVDEIENEIITTFESVLTDRDFIDNLKNPYKIFEKLTAIINSDMDFFGYMLSKNSNLSLSTKIAELLKDRVRSLINANMTIEPQKLDILLEFTISGSVAVYQHWFNSERKESIEEISTYITLLSFEGLPKYLGIDL